MYMWYRNPLQSLYVTITAFDILYDKKTIDNIRLMVVRSLQFLSSVGPILKHTITFEGGYTDTIESGDGDYLTNDTLWDFKVSKNKPRSKDTFQLLIYWILGQHSIYKELKNVNKIGIYNLRFNKAIIYDLSNLSSDVKKIETTVICY